jgi:hypothetical protein
LTSSDFARLAGAFIVLSQGAATLVLGTAPAHGLLRIVVAVVFFSAGTAPLADSEASKPAAVAALAVAVAWTVYVGVSFGFGETVYEAPLLGVGGAGLLVWSSRSS